MLNKSTTTYLIRQLIVCFVVKSETLFLNQTISAINPITPINMAKKINHSLNSVIFFPNSTSKNAILNKTIERIIDKTADNTGCFLTK